MQLPYHTIIVIYITNNNIGISNYIQFQKNPNNEVSTWKFNLGLLREHFVSPHIDLYRSYFKQEVNEETCSYSELGLQKQSFKGKVLSLRKNGWKILWCFLIFHRWNKFNFFSCFMFRFKKASKQSLIRYKSCLFPIKGKRKRLTSGL